MDALSNDMPFVDVLVVGAGPTGLTMANLLGRYGVPTLVVERNPTTVQEPRAVSIDDESLRTLQAAGVVAEVLEHVVAGYGSRYLTPSGQVFLTVSPTATQYGYPRRNAFRQPKLEAQLRTALSRFDCVQTRFGWSLEGFSQDAEGAAYTLRGPAGETVNGRCRYLVGCDGAGSQVRSQLGLVLEGRTFLERWLIVDLENSPTECRDTIVFCDAKRPCIALPGPGNTRRFEFKLLQGETPEHMTDPANVTQLLRSHGAHPASSIVRRTVYTFHARLAPHWRKGCALLAGDACHLTPPFAGQGMNSGIRDAHNLAWKLAEIIHGRLGPGLLDSYELERRPHVRDMIKLALRMGRIMAPRNRMSGAATQLAFRALNIYPGARDYFAQMKYKPKPRFEHGFQIHDESGARESVVGRLLPQPVVFDSHGESLLLDEALGNGFALIGLTGNVERFETATRQAVWQDLQARRLVVSADHPCATAPLPMLRVNQPLLPEVSRRYDDHVLLVRPDRYVAACFPLDTVDTYAEKMVRLCAATKAASENALPRDKG